MTRDRWRRLWACQLLAAPAFENQVNKLVTLLGVVLLCCASAAAGTSQQVFENPPAQVFEAALRVAQKYGTGLAVDREDQIISFTVGSWALSGTDHLTVFFHGLPDGCGKDKPCAATKVEVKANRATVGGLWFKTGRRDVTTFLKRLKAELNRPPKTGTKSVPPSVQPQPRAPVAPPERR